MFEAQVHSQVEHKTYSFCSIHNFPLSQLAIFLQIFQKCALPASAVHAESSYIAKLVRIHVLVQKNGDETTLDELIAAQNRGLTDDLPLDSPCQSTASVPNLYVSFT